MAKTSMIVKCNRKQKFSTREYTRCQRCGRPHSVYRKFGPVPCLLPRAGAQGRASRHQEGQLVSHCQRASRSLMRNTRTEDVSYRLFR